MEPNLRRLGKKPNDCIMKDFFAKNTIIGFYVSLRYLPPRPIAENREGVFTRAIMDGQCGQTMFFEEDALGAQREDFCPVNLMAFQRELFGLVRVADLSAGLAEIKENLKFCGVLAVSHIAWFNVAESKWQTDHPKDETTPFERRIENLKSWPRPAILPPELRPFPGCPPSPGLLLEFFSYLDSRPGDAH
jgi:hypothetical protein